MITLPNGCWYTGVKVSPKDWSRTSASTVKLGGGNLEWRVYYRFYDPTILDTATGKAKAHYIEHRAGINRIPELSSRRKAVRYIIDTVTEKLERLGYNPVTGMMPADPEENEYEIPPSTPFLPAMRSALARLNIVKHTRSDIESILRRAEEAARQLRYDTKPINEVRKRHIRAILDRLQDTQANWSNNQFNHFRRYLLMIFNELSECEAVELNPVRDIKKRKVVRRLRSILSDEQAQQIDQYVHDKDYVFWRYIHLFFHSGARSTEMFRVQAKHVNLERQEVKFLVLKGNQPEEVVRPIKDVAVPFWKEIMRGTAPETFLFARGLEPGKKPLQSEVTTRRWNKLVKAPKTKGGLGINVDFYALKHLNTTQTVEAISNLLRAAEELTIQQTGHKSTAMVSGVYNVGSKAQQRQIVRGVGNVFGRKQDSDANSAAG
jgi:site-specific recombinase XerC